MIKTLKVIIATSARSKGIVISFKMRLFNVLEIMIFHIKQTSLQKFDYSKD